MTIIARCEIERIRLGQGRTSAIGCTSAAETPLKRGGSALLLAADPGNKQKKDDYVEFLHLNSIYNL